MRIMTMAVFFLAMIIACAEGDQFTSAASRLGGGGAAGGGAAGPAGGGGAAGGGDGACVPGATRACYTGPAGTAGIGACVAGVETCLDDGSGFSPCEGEVTPAAESCATGDDDDCDGAANERCACVPGETQACYAGPPGTEGVGICTAGVQTCAEEGLAWGACEGEVLPMPEDINTPVDDDCSGTIHDSQCELHGILECPSGICQQVLWCGSQGGPLECFLVWRCMN